MRMILIAALALVLTACGQSFPEPPKEQLDLLHASASQWQIKRGVDVYEFSPANAPGVQCVFVADYRRGGLQCWKKEN